MSTSLFPTLIASLPGLRHLPWPGPLGLLPGPLERAIAQNLLNRVFATQLADGDLNFLAGRQLRLCVDDMGYDWTLDLHADQLRLRPGHDSADATFRGRSRELLLVAARREDPDTLFFQRRLIVEGDTELGLEVKNLIDAVDLSAMPLLLTQSLDFSADFVEALDAAPHAHVQH